ncbi:MAG: ATP-binding protein [Pirellulales bacterium]
MSPRSVANCATNSNGASAPSAVAAAAQAVFRRGEQSSAPPYTAFPVGAAPPFDALVVCGPGGQAADDSALACVSALVDLATLARGALRHQAAVAARQPELEENCVEDQDCLQVWWAQTDDLCWLEDAAGRCRRASHAWVERLGPAAGHWEGSRLEDRLPAEAARELAAGRRQALAGQRVCRRVSWALADSVGGFDLELLPVRNQRREIVGLLGRARPVADELRDAERVRRTERLASIGTLAAGIAHELNNPLGAIMLEAETAALAARRIEPDPLLASSLEGIRHNVDRCSRIIKGILRFAKHEHGEHAPCDLAAVLRRARDYTRELAAQRGVSVDLGELPAGLPVVGNELALEQVFVNLFNNALEASPRGSIVEVRAHHDPAALRITVGDRGPGIPAAEIQRVFDPFFTTRQQAAGTGLGLSIVQGIVADHQGEVEVSSQVGQGAVFTVSLPRMQDL